MDEGKKEKKKPIMLFADMKTHPFHGQILAAMG